jgi:hypothetical protein
VTSNEAWRKYLEAGTALGQQTVARAEGIARGLFASDEGERRDAWQEVDQLARFGMQVGEQLVDVARAELTRQLKHRAVGSLDDLLERVKDLIGPDAGTEADPSVTAPIPVSENEIDKETKTAKGAMGQAKLDKATTSGKSKKQRAGDKQHKKKDKRDKRDKKDKKEKELTGESQGGEPDRVLSLAKPMGPAPTP